MIYKTKKTIVPEMQKTYCEDEEKSYHRQGESRISEKKLILMFFAFITVTLTAFVGAESTPSKKFCCESHWDGAGDTWTCSRCGTSNYYWEVTCNNCGKSQ